MLAFALAAAGSAYAQPPAKAPPAPPPQQQKPEDKEPEDKDEGEDGRNQGGVPRGGAGAVIVPGKPTPPAEPVKLTMPRLLKYAAPLYPPEAQRAGIEGNVTLKLDIDRAGRVTKAAVETSGGHGFDEAALAAAANLQFEPARRPDGTAAPARILYQYKFTLTPAPSGAGAGAGAAKAPPADVDTLTGTVMASDAPLAGITVSLRRPDGGLATATTDAAGKFRFKNLPPGKYHVEISAEGFQPFAVDEDIAQDEAIEVRYRLSLKSAAAAAASGEGIVVTVRGERPPREVTKRTLERREINRIPGTGGDALRALQNLPGVARTGFGGLLIVRGSAPQDTLTFIDGTPVPLIYHFGGLASVVPTEMLEKIDFYPGNFSGVYGRAMGGIVEVGLRSPKQDGKYHGVVQLDIIDGRLLLEGPIPFLKDWTFLAAGRRSWIDAIIGPALEQAGASVTQAPVYYDYQFMVEGRPSPRERIRLSFYGSDDAFELLSTEPPESEPALTGDFGLHTAFQRLQLTYENRFSERNRFNWSLAFGKDNVDFQLGPIYFLIEALSLNLRMEMSHKFGRYVTANIGADLNAGVSTVNLRAPAVPPAGQPPNQPFSTRPLEESSFGGTYSRPAVYGELEIVPTARARIVPSVRLDYAFDTDSLDVSPRLNGRYDIVAGFPRTTVKGGVGFYYQPPQFQESVEPFGTKGVKSNRAVHYGVGVEQEITQQLEVSVEGYAKQLDQLVTRATTGEYTNDGTGYAVGGEVLLKYKPDERFFGWAAYTLSRSVRSDPITGVNELSPYDQTHVLTVVGSVRLPRGFEVGARFRLSSGNLQTPYVCDPESVGCNPTRLNSVYHAPSGTYIPIPYSDDYVERLPLFHQLDIRADKTWQFKKWQLSMYLDIQNIYNRQGPEGISYNFDYTKRRYVTGLPILPSFGLRGEF